MLGTRKSTKRIIEEAKVDGCEAIVMAADPDRNRLVGDMLWTQEPQRVRRRAKVPVFLVRRRSSPRLASSAPPLPDGRAAAPA